MTVNKENLKKLQTEVSEKSREIWLAGLGAFATVEEEGSKLFNQFVEKGKNLSVKGEELEKKGLEFGKEKKEEVAHKVEEVVKVVEKKVNDAINAVGFTKQNALKDLSAKVDKLAESVAELAKKIDPDKK